MLGLGSEIGRARSELRLAKGDAEPGARARGARKTAMRPQHGTFGSPRMPSESSTVLVPARAPLSACVLNCFGYEYLGAKAPKCAGTPNRAGSLAFGPTDPTCPPGCRAKIRRRQARPVKGVPDLDVSDCKHTGDTLGSIFLRRSPSSVCLGLKAGRKEPS